MLRELQDETGGFTAFIPWYYVPFKTPLRGKEASGLDYLRVLAISRLYLDNFAHLQASWLTPGLKMGQLALFYGCDDMGGTILEERVVHDAGSTNEATRANSKSSSSRRGLQTRRPRHVLEPAVSRKRFYGLTTAPNGSVKPVIRLIGLPPAG